MLEPGARPRQILHVDMDAFYASVEQRDDPGLRGRPVLVGGKSPRSVVCTASYEARPTGARSAMPMGEALRRCPDAIVVVPRMGHYAEVSREVMAILRRYTPLVEAISLDEAFVDVTASQSLFGDGETVARNIRSSIKDELGLTASAGVAPNKFIAKIASDLDKPDGLTCVRAGNEREFLRPLGVEKMWGVGPKAAAKLRDAGLRTIGDLAASSPDRLRSLVGTEWGAAIHDLAHGLDERPVVPEREALSIGAEETFDQDLVGTADLERELLAQAERVAQRMAELDLVASTVTIKVKYSDFTLVSRRTTLPEPVSDTTSLHRIACELLRRVPLDRKRVRLTGLSVSQIVDADRAPRVLFDDEARKKRVLLEKVALEASERFGGRPLVHADTLAAIRRPPRGGGRAPSR